MFENGIEYSDRAFFLEEEVVPLEWIKKQEQFEDEQGVEEIYVENLGTLEAVAERECQ